MASLLGLNFIRLCMSELLENLASCLAAAAEPSERLRAYVEEIDRFLDRSQSLEPPELDGGGGPDHGEGTLTDAPPQLSYAATTQDAGEEMVIPLELLQRIPWDWAEQMQIF